MDEKKILTITLNPAIDYTVQVPDFKTDAVNRASGGRRDPGGKGINAATITAQYKIKTAVSGFLGTENKRIFIEHFENFMIHDRFIYINGPTREGIKIADPLQQITTDINFAGFKIEQTHLDAFIAKFKDIIGEYDYVIMSGSLPENVPDGIYGELASIAAAAGVYTAVDTSREPLRLAIESGYVNLIKPNIDELSDLFDISVEEEKNTNALVGRLLDKVESVALSMGGDGSRLYNSGKCFQASAPIINVASTVGAGDSFLGGFITGLAQGKSPEDALRFAAATAASKLTKAGPGWSKDVPPGSFYDKISITEV